MKQISPQAFTAYLKSKQQSDVIRRKNEIAVVIDKKGSTVHQDVYVKEEIK